MDYLTAIWPFCAASHAALASQTEPQTIVPSWNTATNTTDLTFKVSSSLLKDRAFLDLPLPWSLGTFNTLCHSSHSDGNLLEISTFYLRNRFPFQELVFAGHCWDLPSLTDFYPLCFFLSCCYDFPGRFCWIYLLLLTQRIWGFHMFFFSFTEVIAGRPSCLPSCGGFS